MYQGGQVVKIPTTSCLPWHGCLLSNLIMYILLRFLFLLFSLAPASVEPLNNKLVEKGDSFTLFCEVSGLPAPTVVWTQVSTGLAHHNKTWVITDFDVSKLGEYRCDASNMCGNDSDTMFVSLLGKSMQCFAEEYQKKNESTIHNSSTSWQGYAYHMLH